MIGADMHRSKCRQIQIFLLQIDDIASAELPTGDGLRPSIQNEFTKFILSISCDEELIAVFVLSKFELD